MSATKNLTDECKKSRRIIKAKYNEVVESKLFKGNYIDSPYPQLAKKQERVKQRHLEDILGAYKIGQVTIPEVEHALNHCYKKCIYNLDNDN
jgi:hypothetical protein